MANFCPQCGTATTQKYDSGIQRDTCLSCRWTEYPHHTVGVGAIVVRGGAVLLIERGTPPVGVWTIPGGFVEQNQNLRDAIEREVKEEAGIDVEAKGLIMMRDTAREKRNDFYFVFYCETDPRAQPKPDGEETTQARFVYPDEFDSIGLSAFSRHITLGYLRNRPKVWTQYTLDYRPGAVMYSWLSDGID